MIALASRYSAPADLNRFVERYLTGSRVKVVRDPTGRVARGYGIEYHPYFMALDRKGRRVGGSYSFTEVLAQAKFGVRAGT